jgi:hypothetical protein
MAYTSSNTAHFANFTRVGSVRFEIARPGFQPKAGCADLGTNPSQISKAGSERRERLSANRPISATSRLARPNAASATQQTRTNNNTPGHGPGVLRKIRLACVLRPHREPAGWPKPEAAPQWENHPRSKDRERFRHRAPVAARHQRQEPLELLPTGP